MAQGNKILTVSYGTFSCTMEGFDDNFELVKTIAEYFRDLAAEDRYFGAEPPTPDADMLARMAEKEIARRVEARLDDLSINLRAAPVEDPFLDDATFAPGFAEQENDTILDGTSGQATTHAGAGHEAAARGVADTVARAATSSHLAPNETPSPQISPEAFGSEPPQTASVNATLSLLADDPSDPKAPETEQAADALWSALSSSDPSEPLTDAAIAKLEETASLSADEDENTGALDSDENAQSTAAPEHRDGVSADNGNNTDAVPDEPNSVADRLARIRAVVASADAARMEDADTPKKQQKQTLRSDEFTEDQHAEINLPRASDPIAEAPVEVTRTDAGAAQGLKTGLSEADTSETDAPEAGVEMKSRKRVRAVRVKRGARIAAPTTSYAPNKTAKTPEIKDSETAPEPRRAEPLMLDETARVPSGEDGAKSALSAQDEEDLMQQLAAVEAELANADPSAEAGHDTAQSTEPKADPGRADVPKDANVAAAVQAALSVNEDDGDPEAHDQFVFSEAPETTPQETPSEAARSVRALTRRVRMTDTTEDQTEGDVTRLMAAADAQMAEPEGRSRRNAIAHLRAAVEATKEDRRKGVSPSDDKEAPYREDLDAMRLRPKEGAARRIAPLKLVAEQRVDAPAPRPRAASAQTDARDDTSDKTPAGASERAPQRSSGTPRRIAPQRPPKASEADTKGPVKNDAPGFLDYAKASGACDLPDLLEAAAAYLTLVEKRPQFSRPQLMNKVREAATEDSSREDRLRYFGKLLREGKIEKTAAGRFTASDQIGFQPAKRAAG